VLVAYTRTALAPGAPSFDEMLGDPGLDAEQIAFLQETIATPARSTASNRSSRYAARPSAPCAGAPRCLSARRDAPRLARDATARAS
jgi:geranylgeranyl diphosphate synthase type I